MPTALLDVTGLRTRSRRWQTVFVRKMKSIGADPSMVAAVIRFETGGTFDPTKRNPDGAVGLIQWTTVGAKSQGLQREDIARMSDFQQLELVRRWFEREKASTFTRPVDYYLAVFAPAALRKPDGAEVYSLANSPNQYLANEKMDVDGDKVITVGDVRLRFEPVIAEAKKRPPLIVVDERWPHVLTGLVIAAAASGGGAYALRRRRRRAA